MSDSKQTGVGNKSARGSLSSIIKDLPDVVNGRIPPQAPDVEQAVLGAILIDPDAFFKAIDLINDDCFYRPAHKIIMATITQMVERNEAIDLVTVSEELRRRDQLETVGGAAYIAGLTAQISTSANIEYHSRIVLEKYILRRIIGIGSELSTAAFDEEDDAFDLLDKAEQELFKISAERLRKSAVPINDLLHKAINRLQQIQESSDGISGIPTGFVELDRMTGGFQKSDLIIIAARPSMGKTAFAMSIAQNTALKFKKAVLVFSLEMSGVSLIERMLFSTARVDAQRARTGRLNDADWIKVVKAAGELDKAAVYIDDTPGLTVMEIRAKARRLKYEKNIDMIVVDYLQFVHGPKNSASREQEISSISRALKNLAKELDVPVVALAQLSRQVETRSPKRPILSDLRESGAIEQDADVVMFIYRPEYYGDKEVDGGGDVEGAAEIIIGKQRNGATGTVVLQFVKQFAAFENRFIDYGDRPPLPEAHSEAPINPADFGIPPDGPVPF